MAAYGEALVGLRRACVAGGFGRTMVPRLSGLPGVSYDSARRLVKLAKIARHPAEYSRRIWIARRLRQHSTAGDIVPAPRGFATFAEGALPGAGGVVTAGRRLFEARYRTIVSSLGRAAIVRFVPTLPIRPGRDPSILRSYIRNDTIPYDLADVPEIVEFASNEAMIGIASRYLGEVPILAALHLYVSLANDERAGSQLYHLDQEDFRQLKLIVPIYDVEPDNGPLTIVDAAATARVRRAIGCAVYGRVSDEVVERHARADERYTFVGGAGSALALDTARCLHYGSRVRRGYRFVLDVSFMSRFSVLEPPAYFSALAASGAPPDAGPLARLALDALLEPSAG